MKNDFQPVVGHRFNFRADWGAVECQVLAVEPNKTLSYTWAAYGLESVVTWTLTPTGTGTHLRMEQSGFRPDQEQAYQGAKGGWTAVLRGAGEGIGARARSMTTAIAYRAATVTERLALAILRNEARRE